MDLSIDSSSKRMRGSLLPRAAAACLEAECVLMSLATVSGYLFLEVLAGCCVLTLGVLLVGVPCIKPWDLRFGDAYDVMEQGFILRANANRAGVEVANAHHDAAKAHQRCRRKAEFFRAQKSCDRDISSRLHLPVRLNHNPRS